MNIQVSTFYFFPTEDKYIYKLLVFVFPYAADLLNYKVLSIFNSRPVFNAGVVMMLNFLDFTHGVGNFNNLLGHIATR